jgi:hypothetical protein
MLVKIDMQRYRYLSVLFVLILSLGIVSGVGIGQSSENISDGDRYWVGQNLTYEVENGSSNAELIRGENETFVTELDVNNSTVEVNTTNYVEDGYNLTYSNSSDEQQSVEFELTNQNLNVTTSKDQVTNASSTTLSFDYQSNRNEYNVSVSSTNVSDSELATLFGVNGTEVNESELVVSSNEDTEVNFSGFEMGTYEFTFNVTDTNAADTATVNVSDEPQANVEIEESIVNVDEGDKARLNLQYNSTNQTNVTIGNETDVGYEISFNVENNDDSNDTVGIVFNTYYAGVNNTSNVLTVADDSDASIIVDNETEITNPRLSPATYDVSANVDGTESDFAEINVTERSTEDVRIKTLPNTTSITEVSDISGSTNEEGRSDDGVGSYSADVAENDTVAIEVEMSGVYGYLNDDQNINEVGNGLYIGVTEDTPNSNSGVNLSNSSLYTNPSEETFYVVFNATSSNLNIGSDYVVDVGLNITNAYIEEGEEESVTTNLTTSERETEFTTNQNGTVEVSEDDMIVSAETNIATDSETTLLVRNTDAPNLEEFDAVVENGEFRVNISDANISQGDNFTVQLRGETNEVDGTYLVSEDDSNESTDESDGNNTDEGADNTTDNTTDETNQTDDDSNDSGGLIQTIIEFIRGLIGL